ncbi:hypothetical protein ABZX39_33580 [Streptomyces collinus]|uniref:hypothetical protein n=1 Tax=Streptomyces collinus TaxID=42684 RepID=UPI0033B2B83F
MDDQLATALDQLTGFHPNLDAITAHLEALHTLASSPTLTRDHRQALVARLAGSYEDDLITAVALVAKALCTIPTDTADPISEDDAKTAEQHGQDLALRLTEPYLHQPAAEAAYVIDPTTP